MYIDNHSDSCSLHQINITRNEAIASIIGYSIIGAIGVIGNIIVIFVFYGNRDKTLKVLIFTLALADLTSCGIVLPLDLFRVYRKDVVQSVIHLDHVFADVVVCLRHTVFSVEGSVLFCVALDRYCCICWPSSVRTVTSEMIAVIICVMGSLVFLVEGAVTVIHLFIDTECNYVIQMQECVMYGYIILSFIAMTIFAWFYFRIFWVVRRQDERNKLRKRLQSHEMSTMCSSAAVNATPLLVEPSPTPTQQQHRSPLFLRPPAGRCGRTAVMLFGSTLVFYATLMPMVLGHLSIIPEGPHHKLYYVNNAMNVILYSLLNPNFRKETRKRFKTCCANGKLCDI